MFGGEPGACSDRVAAQITVNRIVPDHANEGGIASSTTQAREEYLSVLFTTIVIPLVMVKV